MGGFPVNSFSHSYDQAFSIIASTKGPRFKMHSGGLPERSHLKDISSSPSKRSLTGGYVYKIEYITLLNSKTCFFYEDREVTVILS